MISIDLITNNWFDIYKGAGKRIEGYHSEEKIVSCEVTVSVQIVNGKARKVRLFPVDSFWPNGIERDFLARGWIIVDHTWETIDDCNVADVRELGDRIESAPYLIQWEETGFWGYVEFGNSKVYSKFEVEPVARPEDFQCLNRWAISTCQSYNDGRIYRWHNKLLISNNDINVACDILIAKEMKFSVHQISESCRVVDDNTLCGAIARFTGFYWTWEQLVA